MTDNPGELIEPPSVIRPDDPYRRVAGPHEKLLPSLELINQVWEFFTNPNAAFLLEMFDRHVPPRERSWSDVLVVLAEQGLLDRGRLIDACLDAFTRDFPANCVTWYERLHKCLAPSTQEIAERSRNYIALLRADSAAGIRVGQGGATRLLDAGLLDIEAFSAASVTTLAFPQKQVAGKQLKLLDRIASAYPSARNAVLPAAAHAFGHQREDVQEAALRLIAAYDALPGEGGRKIRQLAEGLSPGLASLAAELGLSAEKPLRPATGVLDDLLRAFGRRVEALPATHTGVLREILSCAQRGEIAPPLAVTPTRGRPLPEPLSDPGELIELLARLMEDASDPLAVERALAGAASLSGLPPRLRAGLTRPLLKRAHSKARQDRRYELTSTPDLTSDIAALVLAWGTERSGQHGPGHQQQGTEPTHLCDPPRRMDRILPARVQEVIALIASQRPVRLLAEPRFDRGAITQQQLLGRLRTWHDTFPDVPPAQYDLEMAMRRLEPGADQDFWSEWASLAPAAEYAQNAYEEAYQPLSFATVIGFPRTEAIGPGNDNQPELFGIHRHVLAKSDAALARAQSQIWALLTDLSDPLRDHARLYGERWQLRHYGPIVAAWPLLAPWQPELIAAHLLRPLSDGLKTGPSPATAAVACLSHPGHPLGPISHLALMTGFASAEPDTRIGATEVWRKACLDGRLDPAMASEAIITGTAGAAFKLNRIADGLRRAYEEPIAAYRAVQAICQCAPRLLVPPQPNMHQLLAVAASLGSVAGIPRLPPAITDLAASSGKRQLRSAASLLARVSGYTPARRTNAIAQSVEAFLSRAEGTVE